MKKGGRQEKSSLANYSISLKCQTDFYNFVVVVIFSYFVGYILELTKSFFVGGI